MNSTRSQTDGGEIHLVGDDDHGHVLLGELLHHQVDLLDQLGSSAEVASSNSITLGFIASARAMATRCFCPPDSCEG